MGAAVIRILLGHPFWLVALIDDAGVPPGADYFHVGNDVRVVVEWRLGL